MSLAITIDKSTFQSLNYIELVRLNNYYKHNVAPVLVMEILGDLKKEVTEGKTPSDERVKDFARKLFPAQCNVNSYYRNLLKQELEGKPCELDGRPTLDMEKIVKADDGRKGFVIKETLEEKSIYKWKEGKFTEADRELSELWRTVTTKEDLLKNLQKIIQVGKIEKQKSLDEVIMKVNEILSNLNFQDKLLSFAIHMYGEGEIDGLVIFNNWLEIGRPLLSEKMPFVIHCLKVDLIFHFALQSELISLRPTNKVDLEYLYYLPFCNIFTSNDKFHKQLVPLLIRKDQKFIIGDDLKKDLMGINEYLEKEGDDAKQKYLSIPPIIEESLTFNLWKEFFNYPEAFNFKRKISESELANAKEQMDKFIKAMEGGHVEFSEGESEEFIVKKSSLSMDDPCICGSGKKVIDCCVPKEEFIRICKEQSEKK
jgi:hypothetical protein